MIAGTAWWDGYMRCWMLPAEQVRYLLTAVPIYGTNQARIRLSVV